MKKPILSICIATYNRGAFIGETLESIMRQVTDDIEVVIVDGASTDNTKDVVETFCGTYPQIRYIRLEKKGGVDQDYDKSVQAAEGEMCWLFTDDDLLKEGAVAVVMNAMKQDHDLIVVNAEIRDRDVRTVMQQKRMAIAEDTVYPQNAFEKFFLDSVLFLTFIGAVVIRRSVWMSRLRKPYYGTEFIHLGVIFQNVLERSAFIIAEPWIVIRYGNAQWEPRRFNIWMFKWPNLVWSFPVISDGAKLKITPREPWRSFRTLLIARADGEYTSDTYSKHLKHSAALFYWKIGALIISFVPRNLFVWTRSFYAICKRMIS